jgi:hypothetical protein
VVGRAGRARAGGQILRSHTRKIPLGSGRTARRHRQGRRQGMGPARTSRTWSTEAAVLAARRRQVRWVGPRGLRGRQGQGDARRRAAEPGPHRGRSGMLTA